MKITHNKLFIKLIALSLILLSILSCFTYCSQPDDQNAQSTEQLPDTVIDISDYVIIYSENEKIQRQAKKLSDIINDILGASVDITSEIPDTADKIIAIGPTALPCSAEAENKLNTCPDADAFIIDVTDGFIAINGKTETSTLRAVEHFIRNYVDTSEYTKHIDCSAGKSVITPFEIVKTIYTENNIEIDVEVVSTLIEVPKNAYTEEYGYPTLLSRAYYPSIIELKHNGENNGKLIAILCMIDTPLTNNAPNTTSCVMESSDGGKSWKIISRPEETIDPSISGISMAHIYELPNQVGDMPAGTLLYSGTSVNYSRKSHVAIWRSYDCGYTWEEYTIIAEGGGTREGVWEPFTYYDEADEFLYCFYSDDSDPEHDQKLVYKRSDDGVTWSDAVDVCAFDNPADRPGMLIMTPLGSCGAYFMVYEYFGSYNGDVHYKITKDISDWSHRSAGIKLQTTDGYSVAGAPSCVWTPFGGDGGILIASGKTELGETKGNRLFISFDGASTWHTIENPLPYDNTNDALNTNRIGHSPSFIVGSDPSVIYYVNCTDVPETGRQRVQFARLKIYD